MGKKRTKERNEKLEEVRKKHFKKTIKKRDGAETDA